MAWSISKAMMQAYENSHSSQGLVVESLAVTCLDGEQSAPLNTTPTPDQYYWPDKTTEHSRLSRFGMTCEPLMESLGEELLMWFRAGFPAKTYLSQGGGAGIEGERSGLWKEQLRIIREVDPYEAYMENSPALIIRGLGVVLSDLAEAGFDVRWGVFSCADVGGVHLRERIWIKATNTSLMFRNGGSNYGGNRQCQVSKSGNGNSQDDNSYYRGERRKGVIKKKVYRFTRFPWGEDVRGVEDLRKRSDLPEPLIRRIGDDVAFGVDRLKAIGNGQVSRVCAAAWEILSK